MSNLPHIHNEVLWYFLTLVTAGRKSAFNDKQNCEIIKDDFIFYRNKFQALIPAYVIMPDHLHFIVGLKNGDDLSKFVHGFKSHISQVLNTRSGSDGSFWQADYWDHGIRNYKDFIEKIEYIHKNSFGVFNDIEKWPFTSFHNYHCSHSCWFDVDKISI